MDGPQDGTDDVDVDPEDWASSTGERGSSAQDERLRRERPPHWG